MYTDPAQASRELGDMMNLIDNDTIAMWTNAPMGLECVVSFCEVFFWLLEDANGLVGSMSGEITFLTSARLRRGSK
jgi:hypothetical protein